MKRDGGKAHVVAVRRGIVRQPSVIVQDRGAVRVIRITRFSHGVAKDVRRYARATRPSSCWTCEATPAA